MFNLFIDNLTKLFCTEPKNFFLRKEFFENYDTFAKRIVGSRNYFLKF